MRLGVMQPYLFPYLGYFALIAHTDRFVLFDTAQYIRHGWVNRNRILHPKQSWQYILIPLQRHARQTAIADIRVEPTGLWKRRIVGQLDHYRKRAPFFGDVVDLVRECLATDCEALSRVNGRALTLICQRLGLSFREEYCSDLSLKLGPVHGPGDWALRISEAVRAEQYINPVGGRSLFDADQFASHGIGLEFLEFEHPDYDCRGRSCEPGLSVLDALMWNSPATVREVLTTHASIVPAIDTHGA